MLVFAFCTFINCLTSYLLSLCVLKISTNKNVSIIGILLLTILVSLSPWISIPYSDIIGLFFPTFLLFAYLYIKNEYIRTILIAVVCVFGFFIKPTIFIAVLAYKILYLLKIFSNIIKRQLDLKMILSFLVLIVFVSLSYVFFNNIQNTNFENNLNSEMKFDAIHYLKM